MDTLFFVASKLIWILLRPESWLVIGTIFALIFLVLGRVSVSRRLLSGTIIFMLAIGIFPIGETLIYPLEIQFSANPELEQVDGIIVLGGPEDPQLTQLWSQVQFNGSSERFSAALTLAQKFPTARIIFTGGSGSLRDVSGIGIAGTTVAEKFFRDNGISVNRLVLEGQSRNTVENARFTFDLVHPQKERTWVLVTSAFHMLRAKNSFDRAGWEGIVPYPVDFYAGNFNEGIGWNLVKNLNILNIAVREYIGLLAYNLTGR